MFRYDECIELFKATPVRYKYSEVTNMYRNEQPQIRVGIYVPWEKRALKGQWCMQMEDQIVQICKAVRPVCSSAACFGLYDLAS